MMLNDKQQEAGRKMLASSLRLTWFGLTMLASFAQPFMPMPVKTAVKEAKDNLQDKLLEDSLP